MVNSQVLPKGYKQTKVGIIPEDWDVVKLKDILKVSQGLQIVISNRFVEPSNDRVFYITLPYVDGKKIEYIENPKQSILCNKEDLLVVRTGSGVGKIITGVEGAFHNNFFKIKGFKNLNIKFIFFYLTSQKIKFLMKTYASNRTIPDLPHGDFYSLDLILPPLKEQEKIANILTTWDDAISKQDELIKAKDKLKKGLMQKLLSGEVRFCGFFDEWEEVRLEKVIDCFDNRRVPLNKMERAKIKGNIPYYGSTSIVDYINDYIFDDDLVLVSEDGGYFYDFETKPIAFYVTGKSWVNNHAHIIKNKNNKLDLKYLYFSLVHKNITAFLNGGTRAKLNKKDLLLLKIKLPLLQEQKKIAEVLTNADKEIDLLKNELVELKEQKKGLMQKLLTGETRCK